VKALLEQRLDGMPPQQVTAVDVQLLRQVFGRRPLRDAAQDLQNNRAGVAGFLEEGTGKQVEVSPTLATAIIDHRGAMPIMRRLGGWQEMAARVVQPVWLQVVEQPVITRLLIEDIR
jgi:hypothetical protein